MTTTTPPPAPVAVHDIGSTEEILAAVDEERMTHARWAAASFAAFHEARGAQRGREATAHI